MASADWTFQVDLNDISNLTDELSHRDCKKLCAWLAHADTYKRELIIRDTQNPSHIIEIDFMDNNKTWLKFEYSTTTTEAKRIASVLESIAFVTETRAP